MHSLNVGVFFYDRRINRWLKNQTNVSNALTLNKIGLIGDGYVVSVTRLSNGRE